MSEPTRQTVKKNDFVKVIPDASEYFDIEEDEGEKGDKTGEYETKPINVESKPKKNFQN